MNKDNGTLIDAARNAAGFDQLWRESQAEFTHGISDTTPLLEALIDRLKISSNGHGYVLEAGPGRGFHALRLALGGFAVLGIDHSAEAVALALGHKEQLQAETGRWLSVNFIQGNVIDYLEVANGDKTAFYANALLHCMSPLDRRRIYRAAPNLVAVSFKTINDSLRWKGAVIGEEPAGVVMSDEGYGDHHITRLLVEDVRPLIQEAREENLELIGGPFIWQKPGYNGGEENMAEFVGVLFERRQYGQNGSR